MRGETLRGRARAAIRRGEILLLRPYVGRKCPARAGGRLNYGSASRRRLTRGVMAAAAAVGVCVGGVVGGGGGEKDEEEVIIR